MEDSHEEESKIAIDDSEKETPNEVTPEPVKETYEQDADHSPTNQTNSNPEPVSEELEEEEKVVVDLAAETETLVSIDEPKQDPVDDIQVNKIESVVGESMPKNVNLLPDQNGVSPILATEETVDKNGVSSEVVDSLPKGNKRDKLPDSEGNQKESSRDIDLGVSNMASVPGSTENETLVAVTPRPPPRTSWQGCCGLFEVLRGSNR